MSIFSPIFQRRDVGITNPKAWYPALWNLRGTGTDAGVNVNEHNAVTYSVVYRCSKLISDTVAGLPLKMYKKRPNGGRDEITDRKIIKVLNRPNDRMTSLRFRQTLQYHLFIWGNCYIYVVRDNMGRVKELWPMRPDKVEIRTSPDDGIVYLYHSDNGQILMDRKTLLHIPGFGYDGIMGYSIVQLSKQAIGLGMATEEYGARFFGQGFSPGVIFKHPMKLKPETYEKLKGDLQAKFSGLGKSHSGIFLDESMEIQELGMQHDDAQFLETRQFQAVDFCRFAGVPPHLVYELGRATWNNLEEQSREWVRDSVRPWTKLWERDLELYFLTPSEIGKVYFEHNLKDLVKGDINTRFNAYSIGVDKGLFTRNEVRSWENLNPGPKELDEYTVQSQMTSLEQAVKEPEPIPQQLLGPPEEDDEETKKKIEDVKKRFLMRGANNRRRIRESFKKLILEVARVVVNREVNSINRGITKSYTDRDARDFEDWLDDFYGDMPRYIKEKFRPVITAFAEQIMTEAAKEAGMKPELTPALRDFVDQYLTTYSERHVANSVLQLKRIVERWNPDEQEEQLRGRLEEWQEKRPSKISDNEAVRGEGAFTRQVFLVAGVTSLTWTITGPETCPYCMELSGKVVGIETPFVDLGNLTPSGNVPMRIKKEHFHPPLHQGCDCTITIGG